MERRSRRFRVTLFALLYVVQGIGLAYFRNLQKPYLDGVGIDADRIGVLTLVLQLPFVFKIFVGAVSDRVNLLGYGHRKPYIVLGLVLAALAFGGAALVAPEANFALFAVLVTLGSFSVTVFDSTTDGLAIDITPPEEQGQVQGVMVGSRAGAFILLSLLFGVVAQRVGYGVIFPIIGASMLLPLAWVLRIQEPAVAPDAERAGEDTFGALGKPEVLLFALYAVVYSVGSFGVDGLVTYFMSERFGAAEAVIGLYGALRGVGAVGGALVGGWLIARLGRAGSARAATVGVSVLALLLGLAPSVGMVVGWGLLWGVVWAFQETVFFALAMRLAGRVSGGGIAATTFALMMGVSNLGSAVADGAATAFSDDLGFQGVLWSLAVINLLTLVVLRWLFVRLEEEVPAATVAGI